MFAPGLPYRVIAGRGYKVRYKCYTISV